MKKTSMLTCLKLQTITNKRKTIKKILKVII